MTGIRWLNSTNFIVVVVAAVVILLLHKTNILLFTKTLIWLSDVCHRIDNWLCCQNIVCKNKLKIICLNFYLKRISLPFSVSVQFSKIDTFFFGCIVSCNNLSTYMIVLNVNVLLEEKKNTSYSNCEYLQLIKLLYRMDRIILSIYQSRTPVI